MQISFIKRIKRDTPIYRNVIYAFISIALLAVSGCGSDSSKDDSTIAADLDSKIDVPKSPTSLGAISASDAQINVYWGFVDDVSSYQLYRNDDNFVSNARLVSTIEDANSTIYNDKNLNHNTSYYYWIKACNASGCSDFSAGSSATTHLSIPAIPTNFSASAVDSAAIALSWQSVAEEFAAVHYQLYRASDANGTDRSTLSDSLIGDAYHDSSVTHNTSYYYWIKACNASGCSDFSAGSSATTHLSIPAIPTNFSASAVDSAAIALSWQSVAEEFAAVHYQVYRASDANGADRSTLSDSLIGDAYHDSSVTHSTSYYYWIKACNASGCSDFSAGSSATTHLSIPAIPTNFSASAVDSAAIALSWQSVAEEFATVHYQVYRASDANGADRSTLSDSLIGDAYHDSSVTHNTSYYYWIKACNASGCSDFSVVSTAQTQVDIISGVVLLDGTSQLSWDSVQGAGYYEIQASTDSASNFKKHFKTIALEQNPPFSLVWQQRAFSYRVRACDSGGTNCSKFAYLGSESNPTQVAAVVARSIDNFTLQENLSNRQLSWDAFSGADYYEIQASTDSISNFTSNYRTISQYSSTTYDLLNITSTASYRIRACQNSNQSSQSVCNVFSYLLDNPSMPFGTYLYSINLESDYSGGSKARGLWSDGSTIWVGKQKSVEAYKLKNNKRNRNKEFISADVFNSAWNIYISDIWFSGTTLWTVDWFRSIIYAYDSNSNSLDPTQYLSLPQNSNPHGMWSNGSTMWVASVAHKWVYAYNLHGENRGARVYNREINLDDNIKPTGIWSDGRYMWVVDVDSAQIYVYDFKSNRINNKGLPDLHVDNTRPTGLWADGKTMWVADSNAHKIFVYSMDQGPLTLVPASN